MVESAAARQIFCSNVGQLWMELLSQRIGAGIEIIGTSAANSALADGGKILVSFASTPRYNESTLVPPQASPTARKNFRCYAARSVQCRSRQLKRFGTTES